MLEVIKMKDNKQKTIAVRVTEEDYDILNEVAFMTGQSVSSFVRQLCKVTINATIMSKQKANNFSAALDSGLKEGFNENKEAN